LTRIKECESASKPRRDRCRTVAMPERAAPVKVFLVEEASILHERVAAMLGAREMNIVGHAQTPQGSIDGILAALPDVVVLDVQLKGGSGLQVLRAVRRMEPGIAFVVFSLHADSAYRKHYLNEGADRFLDKATEFDQLVSAVECACSHARTNRQSAAGSCASRRQLIATPPRPRSRSAISEDTAKKKPFQAGPPSDAYTLALELERMAWQALHAVPRSDPRYADALFKWQAAADCISTVAAQELSKRKPKPDPI
jgi:DNA-binding NarL/FixJ family response regulator